MARPVLPANAPGLHLVGHVVDGWKVDSMKAARPGDSGGNFSIGYYVTHEQSKKKGFLKAIDISPEILLGDAVRIQQMTEIFNFEVELLEMCKSSSRIVTAITSGSIIPGTIANTIMSPVFYLIFELVDSDARQQVNLRLRLPKYETCEALHQIAAGLNQLHPRIAHQDIKPSNILYVTPPAQTATTDTKIADLGRGAHMQKGVPALYSTLKYMGTMAYSPPELLYGQLSPDFAERRLSCDLYSLGSMVTFFFCGQPTNVFLAKELDPAHLWGTWANDYATVMAYVQAAFADSLFDIRVHVEQYMNPGTSQKAKAAVTEVMTAIEQLCDPNPSTRGHPANPGHRLDLQRYISLFDKLAHQARAGVI